MYFLIQHAPIRWPDKDKHGISISEEAKDLITKVILSSFLTFCQLLEKDRKQRIGSKGDSEEVLAHPFFKGIDLEKLIKKELEPPFKPETKSNFDLSNLVKLDVTESVLPEEGIQKIQEQKDAFEKFGFTSHDA